MGHYFGNPRVAPLQDNVDDVERYVTDIHDNVVMKAELVLDDVIAMLIN